MERMVMTDIGERTTAFDVFASRRNRLAATVRAFMEKRRSRRARIATCACAGPRCQAC